jgi:phage FluMu protein Com
MAKRKNTFTKFAGATYRCDTCGRLTRYTGAQSLGSKLCPQCFDLAGLENDISDGNRTAAECRGEVLGLVEAIEAKGGRPREHFADLLAVVEAS